MKGGHVYDSRTALKGLSSSNHTLKIAPRLEDKHVQGYFRGLCVLVPSHCDRSKTRSVGTDSTATDKTTILAINTTIY